MLIISKSDYNKIIQHAREGLPNEACGLIAGTIDGSGIDVKKVYLLTNVDASKEHFSIDPVEHMKAIKDMRLNGYTPLGNWHSHPDTPSRPSEEDKRLAFDSKALYLILSLENRDEPVLNAFHIVNQKEVVKEEILIR